MNKKLSLPQALAVLAVVLGIAGFFIWRYFSAPAFPAEDPHDKALYNTAVTEVSLNMGELAPAHVSPDEQPRRRGGGGGGGGGGAVTPKGEAAVKEAKRIAKEVTPKYQKVVTSLRQAGIPVAADDINQKAAEGKAPLVVVISLQGNGTVVDGQPTYGVLGYKVELRRQVYTTLQSATPIRLDVSGGISGAVGVTTPETLAAKQEEALDAAIKAIIKRWQDDNPAPAQK